MSRCEEYRQQMLEVEDKIRELEDEIVIEIDSRPRQRKIETLKRKREVLEDKWERSLRRGGC